MHRPVLDIRLDPCHGELSFRANAKTRLQMIAYYTTISYEFVPTYTYQTVNIGRCTIVKRYERGDGRSSVINSSRYIRWQVGAGDVRVVEGKEEYIFQRTRAEGEEGKGRVIFRDAIINRYDRLNRNGIRPIACAGSIISRTDLQGARGSFNARIGVSIIAISFIRLFFCQATSSGLPRSRIPRDGREPQLLANPSKLLRYTGHRSFRIIDPFAATFQPERTINTFYEAFVGKFARRYRYRPDGQQGLKEKGRKSVDRIGRSYSIGTNHAKRRRGAAHRPAGNRERKRRRRRRRGRSRRGLAREGL